MSSEEIAETSVSSGLQNLKTPRRRDSLEIISKLRKKRRSSRSQLRSRKDAPDWTIHSLPQSLDVAVQLQRCVPARSGTLDFDHYKTPMRIFGVDVSETRVAHPSLFGDQLQSALDQRRIAHDRLFHLLFCYVHCEFAFIRQRKSQEHGDIVEEDSERFLRLLAGCQDAKTLSLF